MREAAERLDPVALNTFEPRAAGQTWYGGKGGATRVDYILMDRTSTRDYDAIFLGHEMHRRLRTLVSLEITDHVPLCLHFQYRPWKPPPTRSEGYDPSQMVRSCIKWDPRATQFSESIATWFREEWVAQGQARELDPREPVTKIAEMTWKLESQLLKEAAAIWPAAKTRPFPIMFDEQTGIGYIGNLPFVDKLG